MNLNLDEALFSGLIVLTSPLFTETGAPITIRRRLRERWFSRPWRPLQRTKIVIPQVPSMTAYAIGNHLYMHPAMKEKLLAMKYPGASQKDDHGRR